MTLKAGDRLGPYEIVNLVGAGGMGEVYRARDTRLERTVAIKILSAEIDTPAAREQFDREARAISSLTGPNICTLYDVGTQDDRAFLVMEYLPGETLSQVLSRGPLPLKKVLEYAIQIAGALDQIHRQGLIHRDLKPGNVMLIKSGVKLLDFGLAKIASNPDWLLGASNLTHTLTAQGPLLGTCQYVAPELFAGKKPDTRCDIFAFGAVLYEMITGRRAFDGTTQALTIASILERDPPPMKSPETGGWQIKALEHLVRTCLLKDPEERRQTAHDILLELRWMAELDAQAEPAPPAANRRARPAWILVALLTLAVALTAFLLLLRRTDQKPQLIRVSALPPEKADFVSNSLPAISPNGRRLIFAAGSGGKTQLWVRDLDSATPWAVAGTDGAYNPFWSPDSSEVAFFANAKLRKVKLSGGPSLVLCDAMQGRGGSWNRNGVIVFTPSTTGPIFKVPSHGGKPEPVTALDVPAEEVSHRWPWFLPDGRHFLYTGRNADPSKTAIYVGDLESGTRQRIRATTSNAVYSPPGFLLFVSERALMAEAFDAAHLRTSGEPFHVADQVDLITANLQGSFSASETGVLTYYSGYGSRLNSQLTWFDRSGKVLGTVGEPGSFVKPAISPDGRTLAVDRLDSLSGSYDIWYYDLARGNSTRVTFDSRQDGYPVWSPDGGSIAFAGNRAGHYQIYRKSAGSTAKDEVLLESPLDKFPSDWSRDGRFLIYYQIDPVTKYDIWALPLTGDRKPFPLLQTPFNEHRATLSPDVRWLAYSSDETGKDEIYVQSFPSLGNKWKVSDGGGTRPVWSRDGKELFYIAYDRKLMVSAVSAGAKFEAGSPRPLFLTRPNITRFYDVSPDGRRFLLVDPLPDPVTPPINLIVNWTAGR
jgi:serine/threonine protein kinase/Tol biopolymer transport system component